MISKTLQGKDIKGRFVVTLDHFELILKVTILEIVNVLLLDLMLKLVQLEEVEMLNMRPMLKDENTLEVILKGNMIFPAIYQGRYVFP